MCVSVSCLCPCVSRIDGSDIVTEVVPDNVDQIQVHNGLNMIRSLPVLLGSHLRLVRSQEALPCTDNRWNRLCCQRCDT